MNSLLNLEFVVKLFSVFIFIDNMHPLNTSQITSRIVWYRNFTETNRNQTLWYCLWSTRLLIYYLYLFGINMLSINTHYLYETLGADETAEDLFHMFIGKLFPRRRRGKIFWRYLSLFLSLCLYFIWFSVSIFSQW